MIDAVLYSQNHQVTTIDASYFLETYGKLLNWESTENVLDVGTGDGDVTLNCLLPKMPNDFKKLVGVDISNEMVKISKTKTRNEKINFVVMDICTPTVSVDFQDNFHHIFSFYALNWIQDQRATFKNMYKMLKPGGELFVTCVVQSSFYEVMEVMAKKKKWRSLTANYKNYISVYKYSNDPVKDLKNYLEKEGFICRLCLLDDRMHTFKDLETFKGIMRAVNPFCRELPEAKRDDYFNEFITECESFDNFKICNGPNAGEKEVVVSYRTMVAIATKSSSQN